MPSAPTFLVTEVTPSAERNVLAAAEEVIRRFGPSKATVVDVARALGVSHTAVHKHVGSKAGLRDRVVERWVEATMPPLRAIAAEGSPAPERLRKMSDALIAVKRRRAAHDPELFTAYGTLARDAQSVVAAHLQEMIALIATIGTVQRHRGDRNRPVGNNSKIIGTQQVIAQGHDTFAQVAISRQNGLASPAYDPQASKAKAAAEPA